MSPESAHLPFHSFLDVVKLEKEWVGVRTSGVPSGNSRSSGSTLLTRSLFSGDGVWGLALYSVSDMPGCVGGVVGRCEPLTPLTTPFCSKDSKGEFGSSGASIGSGVSLAGRDMCSTRCCWGSGRVIRGRVHVPRVYKSGRPVSEQAKYFGGQLGNFGMAVNGRGAQSELDRRGGSTDSAVSGGADCCAASSVIGGPQRELRVCVCSWRLAGWHQHTHQLNTI